MYKGSGRGGKGSGKAYGGKGGGATEVEIPKGAAGLVKGKGGRTIEAMQNIPGVSKVSLDMHTANASGGKGLLRIYGTAQGQAEARMHAQSLLNRWYCQSTISLERQFHIDVGAGISAVKFVPISDTSAVADLSMYSPGQQYFILAPASSNGGVEELTHEFRGMRFGNGTRSTFASRDFVVQMPMDTASMCDAFKRALASFPSNAKVGIEVRLGLVVFHTVRYELQGTAFSRMSFLNLRPHKDYKLQFSPQLTFEQGHLEALLAEEDFELIERSCCTVVKVVDTAGAQGYAARFIESSGGPEGGGGDPRKAEALRGELVRMSQCRSAEDLLGVPLGASQSEVRKAFLKKTLLVHPDKNAFAGSEEATKMLLSASEALKAGQSMALTPPNFQVGAAKEALPQLVELAHAKTKGGRCDVLKLGGKLGFRLEAFAEEECSRSSAVRQFLEEAWKTGCIVQGGRLEMGQEESHFSIDTVRFKEVLLFSDGEHHIQLEIVRQKALETGGKFQTFPEVSITSISLDERMALLKRETGPSESQALEEAMAVLQSLLATSNRLTARLCP